MGNLQLSPGSLFANRFDIQHAAGSGGMGTVYRATDRYSGDTVALKLQHAGAGGPDEAERFAREAQLLSEFRHPGIVAHVAHGQTPDGQRFLAMEWLEGQDLGQRLARGPLSVRDSLLLIEQVADALSLAHQRGIVHRDLKPSNLFLLRGEIGCVKILDFGIARRIASSQAMTRTGIVIGTPEYMAPEQARGSRDLTPAADLFSLGCVLYECLTGQPPFLADHVAAVLVRILFEEPPPLEDRRPGIPASLAALVDRLLRKDPAQRIADAAGLRAEILNLGELPESVLAATMVGPRPNAESFAEQEQNLLSIVLAALPEEEIGASATMPNSAQPLAQTDRQALLLAIAALGATADFLANGTLLITVPSLGNAQDQAARAARAALLVKELWSQAIVSMATGRGTIRGRTAVGEVVEAAARSLKAGSLPVPETPASAVLLDSLSARLLQGRFAQTPQPGGALLLYEKRDTDESRPLLGKPTPCVGRDAELNNLEGQLSSCIEESEARVMLVTAPPGVGKSRLRHEFLRRVGKRSDSITIFVGRGDLMSAGSPYGILSDAIQKLCGISGSQPLETQQEHLRARIAQHVTAEDQDRVVSFLGELCRIPFPDAGKPMLQAARQDSKIMVECLRRAFLDWLEAECKASPVLLVLDDLQWGDELTVMALHEALREQAGAPLFVFALARPEVHETFPTLWSGLKMQQVPLKGLSKKASERLINHILGKEVSNEAVARAIEQSGGNALFLEELIRSLVEEESSERPETVLAMLQVRIGRLDSGARRAVRAASVFGQTFWEGGVAAILGLPKGSADVQRGLAALSEAELVQIHAHSSLAGEKEYGFRHALVREAAYSLLTDSDLLTGHRLAAEYMEAAGASSPSVLADHFNRGGERRKAAAYYSRAAEQSLNQGNYLDVLRQVERGVRCGAEGAILGELRSIESQAAFLLDRHELQRESSSTAMKLLRPGSLGWCRAARDATFAALNLKDPAVIMELTGQLIGAEPEADAHCAYVVGLGWLAISAVSAPMSFVDMLRGRLTASMPPAEAIDPTIRRHLHDFDAAVALLRRPKPWTMILEFQRSIDLCRKAGDKTLELSVPSSDIELGWLELGENEGVHTRLSALEGLLIQRQDAFALNLCRSTRGWALAWRQDESAWAEAEGIGVALAAQTNGSVMFPIMGACIVGRVALNRGQFERAEAQTRALMPWLPMLPFLGLWAAAIQLRALLALGRATEAITVAEQTLAIFPVLGGAGHYEVAARLAASEAFHAAGDVTRAYAELRETFGTLYLAHIVYAGRGS